MSAKKAKTAADHGNCCIALLRAVNVGGRSVAMAELRAMLAELGCGNPRTLLQSGNALFAIKARTSIAALETKLENEARRRFGMPVAFMLRTASEWDAIIAHNPFPEAARNDPGHLLLMALKGAPTAAAIKALRWLRGPGNNPRHRPRSVPALSRGRRPLEAHECVARTQARLCRNGAQLEHCAQARSARRDVATTPARCSVPASAGNVWLRRLGLSANLRNGAKRR